MTGQQPTTRLPEDESAATLDVAAHDPQGASLFQNDVTTRALLDALAEAVIVIDGTGAMLHVNQRAVDLFGFPREELIGYPLGKIIPERFNAVHTQYVRRFFEQPHIRPLDQGIEPVGRRKSGAEFPLEISLSYLNTETGLMAFAFCNDATRRKQIERDLKLRNEQLDAFAHTVAHDLNSSLAVVVGFSEQLAEIYDAISPEELHQYLLIVARSGRKMSNIVNELLLFASMRKEEVDLEPLNMAAIVNEAVQRLREALAEHQARLILPQSYPSSLGHAPWVEEVWYNYISNALKYGGSPPRVEVGSQPLDNGQVRFWVKDNGQGLTAEQQAQLFAPYAQLPHPQIKGHGLGLSIVRQIVEKLGGQVGVESDGGPGRGSTFFFTLRGVT